MAESELSSWLGDVLPRHRRLTDSVVALYRSILTERKVDFLNVVGRTKSENSIHDKIKRKGYSKPREQLTDLSGIRIVTFFEEHVRKISEITKELFQVDDENSVDSDRILGDDKIGYRSVHFVCSLGRERISLPEYEGLSGLKFEVQIRTVLQHAWAELAHDRAYKFSGELPKDLQRQLNLYSGMLEVVDKGFDEIARKVDTYTQQIEASGSLRFNDDEINSINVEKLVEELLRTYSMKIQKSEVDRSVVEEMRRVGLGRLSDVAKLVTPEFTANFKKYQEDFANYVSFLRDMMMFADLEGYLTRSGKTWGVTDDEDVKFLATKYGADKVRSLFQRHDIDVFDRSELNAMTLKEEANPTT